MEAATRRASLPLLALMLLSAVFFLLIPTRLHGGGRSDLFASATPTDPFAPSFNWVDDLEQRLRTHFTKKYPAYDFAPYAQELERIRSAINLGDRWGAKREMGRFLQMLASRAYGLGNDAAEELAVLSQRIMPDEEFGIVYPRSGSEP